jgi:hypothetical protein
MYIHAKTTPNTIGCRTKLGRSYVGRCGRARKAGYSYGIVGAKPATPITVTMNAMNKPLINVLRDLGMQMGARGDLNVNAEARAIEVQYASFSNGAM